MISFSPTLQKAGKGILRNSGWVQYSSPVVQSSKLISLGEAAEAVATGEQQQSGHNQGVWCGQGVETTEAHLPMAAPHCANGKQK